MANSIEMLRLMRHAADRLAEEAPLTEFQQAITALNYNKQPPLVQELLSVTAAMALAESVLRVVVAAMEDEPEPMTREPETAIGQPS
jgi:hypothetical protein